MAKASGTACASGCAAVAIDTELQPAGMDIIGQGLDAVGKAFRIGLDEAIGIALAMPAVVQVDVRIAGIAHTRLNERIGDAADKFLVDITGKFIPSVPTHLRAVTDFLPFLRLKT